MVLDLLTQLCILLQVTGVFSASHSYRYYYTGITENANGQPVFTATAYVDDYPIGAYTSHSKEFKLQTEWIKEKTDPELWERNSEIFQGWEIEFKKGVRSLMNHYNHTDGFHTLQWMYGCELHDNGSISGYDLDGYDGKEFMALDLERVIHTASLPEAETIAQKWNTETNEAERMKNYLQEQCIESLKKYIRSGKENLERKVLPEINISEKTTDNGITLHCHAYGFYPRDIDVKWMRNHREEVPCQDDQYILPNTDGTYQVQASIHILSKDGDSYSCHIDHSSQTETRILTWKPTKDATIYIVMALCVSVIVLVTALVVIWKRRGAGNNNSNYALSTTEDKDVPVSLPAV
ncbi:MHC class I antigen [Pelobates cultripes]|uniref:MHC class I antigen n=1 Tax=Pelobates cultripes TaxID=61616 RepID=A0AAD1TKR8_PELCU|nr:MHC class I antigen [Pelobates cultripes]